MMLAYQPVRSLATVNISIGQGISASKRILPIIDDKRKIIIRTNNTYHIQSIVFVVPTDYIYK